MRTAKAVRIYHENAEREEKKKREQIEKERLKRLMVSVWTVLKTIVYHFVKFDDLVRAQHIKYRVGTNFWWTSKILANFLRFYYTKLLISLFTREIICFSELSCSWKQWRIRFGTWTATLICSYPLVASCHIYNCLVLRNGNSADMYMPINQHSLQ